MFDRLTTQALATIRTLVPDASEGPVWHISREADRGDLATSVAMQLGKQLGSKPLEIAEIIRDGIKGVEGVAKVEAVAPGYVNVWLTPDAFIRELAHVVSAGKPTKQKPKDKPVIVEYSQPNIAKPLGAHHIIGTVLGQALSNIHRHLGHSVIAWNYIGDWGTQFGKLAVAFELWGDKPAKDCTLDDLLVLYVRFHEELAKDATLEDRGRAAFAKLEKGDKDLRKFWKDVVDVTKSSLGAIYDRLHVSFDLDLGESFYEDKMEPLIAEGIKKKVFTEGKEGALIVEFPEDKALPPYLIRKGDGATLYSTRDLAQMRYRIDTYSPAAIYIFTDIAQKLHFEQLTETCRMLGWKLPVFENVLFGRMRFADKSMSTRKGNILKLEHVLDEAVARAAEIIKERGESIQTDNVDELAEMMGCGAIVYGIVSQNRKMDIVFDWDKMLSFEGNSAPYIQYTHARARSVLRKAEAATPATPKDVKALAPTEQMLLRTLLQFPDALEQASATHMPHKLANFLYELCQDFNAFYNAETIVKAEEPQRSLRLFLTSLVAGVLKTGAELLTLRVPERM